MIQTYERIESEAIEAMRYSTDIQVLAVRFRQSKQTYYYKATQQIVTAFVTSESKGRFFNRYIRNNHHNLTKEQVVEMLF